MRINNCHNTNDFRTLARRRLPAPIFHYIDGGADDETTLRRNTEAFNAWDLIPNVLAGMETLNLSTNVLGCQLDLPLFLAPTAMQRLFHHDGEIAVARAAAQMGTIYGTSTIATTSIEEIGACTTGPKLFQLYVHKDQGLTNDLIDRCKVSRFNALALTVDTIVSGNRERDFYTGMTTPPRFTLGSLISFALHPGWSLNYLLRKRFELANVARYIRQGTDVTSSVVEYINSQMATNISWDDARRIRERWGGPFAIKGIMSVADARRAVNIGASAIMISNHGGRQLDGSRAPMDQLAEIVDAVGDRIEVILDGGIRRGTHVLKALALGAKACSGGRMYLYALAAGGAAGIQRAMTLMRDEIVRDMMLMGCKSIKELDRSKIARRTG
ncbi:MAG: alpha-hydroxy-acid oxidizing enzyme [Gammaproteobacteria bacterium]|nr:alpha-hydroxy-acid oxidizing enzyme [Gammaproteobacteria bacterium]